MKNKNKRYKKSREKPLNQEMQSLQSQTQDNYETKYLKEVSKRQGVIISTGGGAVKKKENIDILKKNGIIIFLNRAIENILEENHENRPLLQNIENLWKLYDERIKLYRKYADIIIKNDDDMNVIVERIITVLKGKL